MSLLAGFAGSGFVVKLFSYRPVSFLYRFCVAFLLSAFVPFGYAPFLTVLFVLSSVLSVLLKLYWMCYSLVVFAVLSSVLFGFLASGKFKHKVSSSVLSYLFLGSPLFGFVNFALFSFALFVSILGVVLSWF